MPKRDPRGGAAERSGAGAAAQPRCEAQTKQGRLCQSFALPGSTRCIAHDPERASDVQAARARGGAHASKLRALQGRRSRLDSPRALLGFTATLIYDVVEGKLVPEIGRTALYGISIQRQLLESSDLEQRLAALEAQVPAGRRGRWRG